MEKVSEKNNAPLKKARSRAKLKTEVKEFIAFQRGMTAEIARELDSETTVIFNRLNSVKYSPTMEFLQAILKIGRKYTAFNDKYQKAEDLCCNQNS